MNLKGRNFLTLKDFTPEEIGYLLDLAAQLKEDKKKGKTGDSLKGKNIALIFEKPSTRTRCAFTIGCIDEGGHPVHVAGVYSARWYRRSDSWLACMGHYPCSPRRLCYQVRLVHQPFEKWQVDPHCRRYCRTRLRSTSNLLWILRFRSTVT